MELSIICCIFVKIKIIIMDVAEIHYLSTKGIYLEPLHIIQMRAKMKELAETLKLELEFTEKLHKEGLL